MSPAASESRPQVYRFGRQRTDGEASMKNLLGGKGANLAEMCRLGIPVPPGFTISTEASTIYSRDGRDAVLALIRNEVQDGIAAIEREMGKSFGDAEDPLLVSVRSGARVSMQFIEDGVVPVLEGPGGGDVVCDAVAGPSVVKAAAEPTYSTLPASRRAFSLLSSSLICAFSSF